MKASIVVIALVFYSSLILAGGVDEHMLSSKGKEWIRLCMMKYTTVIGVAIPEEIDRVYIQVFLNGQGLLFTRGALGTFSKHSVNYRLVLSCSTANGEVESLEGYVEGHLSRPLFKKPGYDSSEYEEYEDGTVIELLYKKVNHQFEYCCAQRFDENNFAKNNPDIKYSWDETEPEFPPTLPCNGKARPISR